MKQSQSKEIFTKVSNSSNLTQITLRSLLDSAPAPGEWVFLRAWVESANQIATQMLDGVPITVFAGGRILREVGFVVKHKSDGPYVAVTGASLKKLENEANG